LRIVRFWFAFFAPLVLFALLLAPAPAMAALPELRLSPLRYDAHLEPGHPKTGFIDASNPTGSTLHLAFQVQAFRQINDRGELEYYNDDRIASAITPAVSEFDLGPREAIRTKFTIDPNRLGPGGAYAVIFLRTVDAATPGHTTTSARVGSLLILDVGTGGTRTGRLTGLSVPRLVFGGNRLTAGVGYANTGHSALALAFAPTLTAQATWSPAKHLTGPFVFPGRTRRQSFSLPAVNRLGLVQLSLTDATGHSSPASRWVFLMTGYWTWVFPLLVLALLLAVVSLVRWKKLRLHFSPYYHVGK
jgi:hypothetical protein